jgi:hypothetical protein
MLSKKETDKDRVVDFHFVMLKREEKYNPVFLNELSRPVFPNSRPTPVLDYPPTGHICIEALDKQT